MTERPLSLPHPLIGDVEWTAEAIVQQPFGQLSWGHDPVLSTKLKTPGLRLAFALRTTEYGWSPSVRDLHIEQELGRLPDAMPGEEC